MAEITIPFITGLQNNTIWNDSVGDTSGDGDSCSADRDAERITGYLVFDTDSWKALSTNNKPTAINFKAEWRLHNDTFNTYTTTMQIAFRLNQINTFKDSRGYNVNTSNKSNKNYWSVDYLWDLPPLSYNRDSNGWSGIQTLTLNLTEGSILYNEFRALQTGKSNNSLGFLTSIYGTYMLAKGSMYMRNVSATISYTPGCYIYTYDFETNSSLVDTITSTNNSSVTLPTGVKVSNNLGYICNSYHYSGSTNQITTISAPSGGLLDKDQTLYCNWTKIYRVFFMDVNGADLTDNNYDKYLTNSVACPTLNETNLNKLTESGYDFIGWSQTKTAGKNYLISYSGTRNNSVPAIADSQLNGDGSGSATADGFAIVYYPKLLKQYKVNFHDGSGNLLTASNSNKLVGDTVTVPTTSPSKTGYLFKGWTLTPDSGKTWKETSSSTTYTVEAIADNQVNGSATDDGFEINYYPVFAKVYKVIFKDKTGSVLTENNTNLYAGDAVTVPTLNTTNLDKLTELGYDFIGWSQTVSSGKNYLISHTGTLSNSVPEVADEQINGAATSNGFEIIYYPKELKKYKIIFYNSDGTVNTTFSNKIKDNSVTTPAAITRASYVFKGWTKATGNQLYQNVTTANIKAASTSIPVTQDSENGSATSDGFEIKYYGVWNPLYSIIYKDGENTIYTDTDAVERTMNYTVLGITNANFTDLKNNSPSKQLLGWNTSSTATTTTSTVNSVTSDITLYAIWRNRDSLIFQENGTTITSASGGTVTGTYGNFTITGYAAVENGIYYYDQDTYQNCTYLLNTTNTKGKSVYISSVTTTSNLISGAKTTDGRQWTATRRTATNGTAITINITLVKNALVTFFVYLKRRTDYTPSNFSSAFTITSNTTVARSGWSLYTQNSSNVSADTAVPTWRHISRKIYMNPTDSVNFLSNCSDVNCYISRFLVPNGTNNMSSTWNPTQSVPSNLTEVSRITAKTNASSNTYPKLADTDLNQSQRKGEYTFTATTAHMGTSISSNKNIKIYVEYEPFNCQFNITNINYTSQTKTGNNITPDTCVTDRSTFLRIFNDASNITRIALDAERRNNSSKYTISDVTINNESLDFKKNDLLYGTNSINNFSVLTMTNDYNGNVGTTSQDSEQSYYLNRFIGYHVGPNDESLITTYHEPYNINITWNNKDYKCFIILKLPVKNDDTNTTETDTNDVLEKVLFTGTDWSSYSDEILNRGLYIKELTDATAATTINTVIQDVANSGYILKDIKKCSYNGNYNSTINKNTITREQLDGGSASLPTGWTRNYSTTSNDVLTLNENALIAGSVDYYFITYEEGLPIFYPNNENESKRAIQLYWEGVRAIGLYYENTRLL